MGFVVSIRNPSFYFRAVCVMWVCCGDLFILLLMEIWVVTTVRG